MEKERPWSGQPSDRGRLKNKSVASVTATEVIRPYGGIEMCVLLLLLFNSIDNLRCSDGFSEDCQCIRFERDHSIANK